MTAPFRDDWRGAGLAPEADGRPSPCVNSPYPWVFAAMCVALPADRARADPLSRAARTAQPFSCSPRGSSPSPSPRPCGRKSHANSFFLARSGQADIERARSSKRALLDGGAANAGVAELVDAPDLGSGDESRGGSSPSARTSSRCAREADPAGVNRDETRSARFKMTFWRHRKNRLRVSLARRARRIGQCR